MGAPVVGDQRAPPSPFAATEPPELEPLPPPELLPDPELEPPEPLDPLDPLEPLDPLDPPTSPDPEELELDPLPEPEPPGPEDAPAPASVALVPFEEPGSEAPPPPEHPIDEAREARRTARTRASTIMGGRTSQGTYRAWETATRGICRTFSGASEVSVLVG